MIFRLCLGLTNYQVIFNPLRANDERLYGKLKNRWYSIGKSQAEKRKRVLGKYRGKLRREVDMKFRAAGSSDWDATQSP